MRRRARILLTISSGMLTAGCAADPRDIAPAYASPIAYQNLTCEQLTAEGHRLVAAEADASAKQSQVRTEDGVGLVLIGLPISSMTGKGVESEISRLKGEHQALYNVALAKGCAVQPVPANTPRA